MNLSRVCLRETDGGSCEWHARKKKKRGGVVVVVGNVLSQEEAEFPSAFSYLRHVLV